LKNTLKDNLYIIQQIIGLIGVVVILIFYFQGAFASNDRVDEIEKKTKETDQKVVVVQSILCKMAIEQKLISAVEICTQQAKLTVNN